MKGYPEQAPACSGACSLLVPNKRPNKGLLVGDMLGGKDLVTRVVSKEVQKSYGTTTNLDMEIEWLGSLMKVSNKIMLIHTNRFLFSSFFVLLISTNLLFVLYVRPPHLRPRYGRRRCAFPAFVAALPRPATSPLGTLLTCTSELETRAT